MTTTANDRQEGGDHYKKREYQHWDFVVDTGMHYLLGCATKYVARWRDKNGAQDLKKAVHYLEKAAEAGVAPPPLTGAVRRATGMFVEQLDRYDNVAIRAIMRGQYDDAISCIQWMLEASSEET